MLGVVTSSSLFITLSSTCKQKYKEINRPSSSVIFLSKTFEKLTIVLAQAFIKAKELSLLPAISTLSTSDNFAIGIEKK